MQTVRLGLFGCGSWGRNILRDAVRVGATVFVIDPDMKARTLAAELGAAATLESDADLPEVDGLVVATPASTHFDTISRLLDLGVPVFSEKPLTLDLGQANELVRRGDGRLFVLHVWRHHAGVAAIRDIYKTRELGAPRLLRTTRANWSSPRTDCDPVWTLLPHDLSIILEVTGDVPPAISSSAEHAAHGACGLVATLRGSLDCVVEVSTRHATKRREIRLHCDDGVAELSADGRSVVLHRGDDRSPAPRTEIIRLDDKTPLEREIASVITYLRGGPPPSSSAADALVIATRMHEIRRMAGI